MGKKIIFLGATGIEKGQVVDRLCAWAHDNLGHEFAVVDFEHEYLANPSKGGRPLSHFLDQPVREQFEIWRTAWDRLVKDELFRDDNKNYALCVHACIVRGNYGVRAVCDLQCISALCPDIIVTLIDDVCNQWWRTEYRARGEFYRGRPTLEQLIMARRAEQLMGDMLAFQRKPAARHLVLAASHPRRTLGNYIFTGRRLVYLSFPITRPREMLAVDKDDRGIRAVNDFVKAVYAFQDTSPLVAFVNPLSLDELPLLEALTDPAASAPAQNGKMSVPGVSFDPGRRWDLGQFWRRDHCLSCDPPQELRIPLVRQQVEDAAGLIRTDVGWRDFRLVMQADALAVCCPVMARDRLSRGVEAEMLAAISESKPVYVFQDPELDPNKKFLEWLGSPGSMSADRKQQWIVEVGSVEEMLRRITS